MSRNGHQDVTFAADNKSLNNIKRPTWTKLKSSAYSTATAATAGRLSREDIVAHVSSVESVICGCGSACNNSKWDIVCYVVGGVYQMRKNISAGRSQLKSIDRYISEVYGYCFLLVCVVKYEDRFIYLELSVNAFFIAYIINAIAVSILKIFLIICLFMVEKSIRKTNINKQIIIKFIIKISKCIGG